MQTPTSPATRIAELNDEFRRSSGKRSITPGVATLSPERIAELMRRVAEFSAFTEGNDPYGEHDFGAVELHGERYFRKIDYYDLDLQFHSPDPSDPSVTQRILVLMRANEY